MNCPSHHSYYVVIAYRDICSSTRCCRLGGLLGAWNNSADGAAIVDTCAPHGRAMLTQAQKRLENLQALKGLESVASESFGML